MITTDPIAVWHHAVETRDLAPFEALLADDVVFQSPAVHAPQPGKPIVAKYLRAAMSVLNNGTFRYLDEWHGERSAILEFEATIDGISINGIDLIRWNEAGQVVNFKVMVRPMKALNLVAHNSARRRSIVTAWGRRSGQTATVRYRRLRGPLPVGDIVGETPNEGSRENESHYRLRHLKCLV
jgi:hypothetical protein